MTEEAWGGGESAPAESALPENRYRAVFERALDAIVFADDSGNFIEVNSAALETFGLTPDDLASYRVQDFAPPGMDPDAAWARFLELGQLKGQFRAKRSDGRPLEIEMSAVANVVPGIHMAVMRDVTAKFEAEQAVRRSEEQFRTLAERSPDVIYRLRLSPVFRVEYLSPTIEEVSGYTPFELAQDPELARDILDPERLITGREAAQLRGAVGKSLEVRWTHRDGRLIWVSQKIVVERDESGEVVAIEGTVRDITNKKREEVLTSLFSQIDRGVLEGASIDDLLDQICQAMSDAFQFPLVWVGKKRPGGEVEVAAAGGPGTEYLKGIQVRWDDSALGQGPAGRAVAGGRTQVASVADEAFAPWRGAAERYGFKSVAAIPLNDEGEVVGTFVCMARDAKFFDDEVLNRLEALADRVAVSMHVARSHERVRLQAMAMDSTTQAMVVADAEGRIVWANNAYARLIGVRLADCVGRPLTSTAPRFATNEMSTVVPSVLSGKPWRGELVDRNPDGSIFTVIGTAAPIVDPSTGKIAHLIAAFEDVTALRQAEEQLNYQAVHDPLTGLPNRVLLLDRLTLASARALASGGLVGVLIVDIDEFKLVNESLGYSAGDEVLMEAAQRVRMEVDVTDTVARIAGDRFAIVTEPKDPTECAEMATRIATRFAEPFELATGEQVAISASVGVAIGDGRDESAVLLRNAEVALRQAQEHGMGQVDQFQEEYREQSQIRLETASSLRKAIENREFRVHYQPVIDLRTSAVVGAECLVRWEHPERGMMYPGDFIEVAERTGQIVQIGEYILDAALEQLAEWRRILGPDRRFQLAVNLSAVQIEIDGFTDYLERRLSSASTQPGDISFEITETVLLKNIERARALLERLSSIGVGCAIDDFGTGYSSLSYLHALPVDTLKIDRSFVSKADESEETRTIVNGTVAMAHSLGITTVAEGVETEAQLEAIRMADCDLAQGFFFARPGPPEDLEAALGGASLN